MMLTGDLAAAFKALRRGGLLPVAVVLILAVPIGTVTAIFSVVHAVLIKPLPMPDPDRILLLWGRDDAHSQQVVEVSVEDRRAWLAGQTQFTAIELFGSVNWGELHVTGPGRPFRAAQNAVSAGFFDVLGTHAMLGRTFRAEDERPGARLTVVLSADLWQQQFSSDPSIVGRLLTVRVGGKTTPVEVVGVMPRDFRFPAGAEVWVALGPTLEAGATTQGQADGVRAMYGIGRLAPGATQQKALAELSTIARNEELKNGMTNTSMAVVATPLLTHMLGPARPALLAIASASCVLLLIACADAAALLLVHGARRRREVAVRCALGARRMQIVCQLFCESMVLCVIAGALGMAFAYAAFGALVSLAPVNVPRLDEATIDTSALAFALAVCLGTAVVVGLLPAWRASGAVDFTGLQGSWRPSTATSASVRARRLLVAAQLAAVVVLLTAAGLFVRSFASLLRLDLGFDPRGVLTFDAAPLDDEPKARQQQRALVDAVLDRVRQLPGVVAAGAVYQRPFANGAIGMDTNVIVEGQPLDPTSASRNPILNWEAATPDYFKAMDIRLLDGRVFDERDTAASPPVVVIGRSLADRLWPGQRALGRRLLTYGAPDDGQQPVWQTVVGVVEDVRYREVERPRFDLYLPYRQAPNPVQHFVVRVSGDPRAAVPALKATMTTLETQIRVDGIMTMEDVVGRTFAPWRFNSIVVSGFAIIALLFAVAGIAMLVAFAVTQRTREIGVRLALGAQTRDVVGLVAVEGGVVAFAGLAVGVVAAWLLRRSVESMLFGVPPGDPLTFGGVTLLLGGVSLLAAYLPARAAARIDPVTALRAE